MTLVIVNARVVTVEARQRDDGPDDVGVILRGSVRVEGDRIADVVEGDAPSSGADRIIDADGRVLMPAFVDCHTHACWAGDRLDEWDRKRAGASYLDILKSGGGIMSTVRAVRAASEDQLASALLQRLGWMLREGSTTVEVKSGYGLCTEAELKMLRAIRRAGTTWPGTVVPTACIGHAIDPDVDRVAFIDRTINETLPAVHDEFPGVTIDAYCEEGAWSLDECLRLFEAARRLGHPCRVHADQFHGLGMVREAVARGVVSVDHLEATGREDLALLARSGTHAVMLPCTGFHTDGRYADGRTYLDASPTGDLAIATNCNPGSAPCSSMPMAIALAVRCCGLSTHEALAAATRNAAAVLGLPDRGCVRKGDRADLVILRHTDERLLAFEFGGSPVDLVVCGGEVVWDATASTPATSPVLRPTTRSRTGPA